MKNGKYVILGIVLTLVVINLMGAVEVGKDNTFKVVVDSNDRYTLHNNDDMVFIIDSYTGKSKILWPRQSVKFKDKKMNGNLDKPFNEIISFSSTMDVK